MFGMSKPGANAYAKVGVETDVLAATPHKLIVLLFDGAIVAVQIAMKEMTNNNIQAKAAAVSKAVNIINEGLRASLNKKVGGELAANLDDLYDYIGRQIMRGNIRNDRAMLEEAVNLLTGLRASWNAIGNAPSPATATDSRPTLERAA